MKNVFIRSVNWKTLPLVSTASGFVWFPLIYKTYAQNMNAKMDRPMSLTTDGALQSWTKDYSQIHKIKSNRFF